MLTLITGTPGAGKSLYSVWEIARKVPGSTIENGQQPVARTLYSNIKNLLVEHKHITADDLNAWHTWAQPGDVILFDEVQEVWRPRGISNKVPDSIAKLETHRHMGVDIVLVTQHPMLLDQNIRRLVNQHLHLRRITRTVAMVYEWDHCSNPGTTKTCVNSRIWMHPKGAYSLYKSAQVHTKPKAKIPGIAFVGLLALAGLAYAGPLAFDRITNTFNGGAAQSVEKEVPPLPDPQNSVVVDGMVVTTETTSTPPPLPLPVEKSTPLAPVLAGCVSTAKKCICTDEKGQSIPTDPGVCEAQILGNSSPGQKQAIDVIPDTVNPLQRQLQAQTDSNVLAFMKEQRVKAASF
jgi:zona occludens toxin